MGLYLAHGSKIYLKAYENPRAFSRISDPIFLESSIQCPEGVGLHEKDSIRIRYVATKWISRVNDYGLSMSYRTQLTNDKWNLFLVCMPKFEGILLQFLEEKKDVMEGIQVNVYDKGEHQL